MNNSENAHAFFVSLASQMDKLAANGRNFTADDYNTTFLAAEAEHHSLFARNSTWEHCRGTTVEYRGFTCGLWTTFHAMTVRAYQSAGRDFDPLKPLKAIRGWVESFFSCHSCRTHFLKMTAEEYPMNSENVKTAEDTYLYLWRAHNRVNNRLKGDFTEDPQFRKYQFPASFLCEECFSPVDCYHKKAHIREWDLEGVKSFLLNYYTRIKPFDSDA